MSISYKMNRAPRSSELSPDYLLAYDASFNIETLKGVQEMEDYLIELGYMTEEERMPVPEWLTERLAHGSINEGESRQDKP
jgi:hypothetical protein